MLLRQNKQNFAWHQKFQTQTGRKNGVGKRKKGWPATDRGQLEGNGNAPTEKKKQGAGVVRNAQPKIK